MKHFGWFNASTKVPTEDYPVVIRSKYFGLYSTSDGGNGYNSSNIYRPVIWNKR